MKKSWYITAIACILLLGCGFCVLLWPRTVPFSQCSDLYKKYAKADGINAAFVMDYRINDTLNLDVTVLQATDSNGWKMLLSDFNIPDLPPIFKQRIDNGEDIIFTKKIFYCDTLHNTSIYKKTTAMVAQSFLHHTLTIIHVTDDSQLSAIWEYNYPSLNNNQNPKSQ